MWAWPKACHKWCEGEVKEWEIRKQQAVKRVNETQRDYAKRKAATGAWEESKREATQAVKDASRPEREEEMAWHRAVEAARVDGYEAARTVAKEGRSARLLRLGAAAPPHRATPRLPALPPRAPPPHRGKAVPPSRPPLSRAAQPHRAPLPAAATPPPVRRAPPRRAAAAGRRDGSRGGRTRPRRRGVLGRQPERL
jgi:hypothetical protein